MHGSTWWWLHDAWWYSYTDAHTAHKNMTHPQVSCWSVLYLTWRRLTVSVCLKWMYIQLMFPLLLLFCSAMMMYMVWLFLMHGIDRHDSWAVMPRNSTGEHHKTNSYIYLNDYQNTIKTGVHSRLVMIPSQCMDCVHNTQLKGFLGLGYMEFNLISTWSSSSTLHVQSRCN